MTDLTITFLGIGTSHGVPMIGCDCGVCRSTDPRDFRTRSSIYVETPESAWVVDTGADFRAQVLREKIRRLDAVVYTHSHTDHIMGFDDLRAFCFDRDLPIYASKATMNDLERVFIFAFNGENLFPGYVRPLPRIITGPFMLGETEITPLPVLHGLAHVNGYLLTRRGEPRVAYLSDCKVVPETTLDLIRGVPVLIIDALRHRPHPTHLSVNEALEISRRIGAQQTWFTHLCHDLAHAATEADLPPGVNVAFDGLKLKL